MIKRYVKTNNYHTVSVNDEQYVLFNTILNHPIILGKDAFDWFELNEFINTEELEKYDLETKEVVEEFISSYLYLPEGITEWDLTDSINKRHLKNFETAKLFDCLDLRISEICNFGCPHCIASGANVGRIMDFNTAKDCVDAYIELKRKNDPDFKIINVHFGNCEPLINYKVIKEIIEYIQREYQSLTLTSSINTNLSLLTTEMASFFAQNDVQIYTSLDGPQKGNDAIRIYKDGKGTYNDIISKFEIMKKVGTPIEGISITINDLNFPYINDDFFEWCINKNFISVAVDFDLVNSTTISNEEKTDFLCNTWKKMTKKGIEFYGTWITPFLNLSNESSAEKGFAFCRAASGYNFSVDAQKKVYACSYSSEPMSELLSFKKAIMPGGRYYKYVKERLSGNLQNEKCLKCFLYGACAGQCEMSVQNMDAKSLETQCDFYRSITEKMLAAQVELMEEV